MTRYYGGVYFSFTQAVELDAILNAFGELPRDWRDTGLAAAMSTASDVVNTIGKQFAQPIRLTTRHGAEKPHLIGKVLRDRALPVLARFQAWLDRYLVLGRSRFSHEALRQDYREFLTSFQREIGSFTLIRPTPETTTAVTIMF